MSDLSSKRFTSQARWLVVGTLLLTLAACASNKEVPSYQGQESTLSDAQAQAQGRSTARSASQIHLGLGGNTQTQESTTEPGSQSADKAAIAATIRPLRETKTFLGTLPCLLGGDCQASRVTLTLAPNSQWRARFQALKGNKTESTTTQQGCWEVTGTNPWRIRLISTTDSKASTASFSFVNDNQLRVISVNDHQPVLAYHLTRQADIDAIKELDGAAAPACR